MKHNKKREHEDRDIARELTSQEACWAVLSLCNKIRRVIKRQLRLHKNEKVD